MSTRMSTIKLDTDYIFPWTPNNVASNAQLLQENNQSEWLTRAIEAIY